MDLTKRKMIHEGPLGWKVNRDKSIGESSVLWCERVERREQESQRVGGAVIRFLTESRAVPQHPSIDGALLVWWLLLSVKQGLCSLAR